MNKPSPSQGELIDAIAEATRAAVSALFRARPEHFYYCALITTGEALSPQLSAWSVEMLDEATRRETDPTAAREALKWSYADSPVCGFGEEYFGIVRALFADRPAMNPSDSEEQWLSEWEFRLGAMEAAMARLDAEGLFGRGRDRSRIVINVEVMPPDLTNTERAIRLNPAEALEDWLREASEA